METVQTEVLVCGGRCAGIAAALASARNGAKTLLIRRADSIDCARFNLVPGFEAVPIFAVIPKEGPLTCRVRMQA